MPDAARPSATDGVRRLPHWPRSTEKYSRTARSLSACPFLLLFRLMFDGLWRGRLASDPVLARRLRQPFLGMIVRVLQPVIFGTFAVVNISPEVWMHHWRGTCNGVIMNTQIAESGPRVERKFFVVDGTPIVSLQSSGGAVKN